MKHTRRKFIKLGSNLATGFVLAPVACKLMPKEDEAGKIKAFGIQLWTVKSALNKDPQGVLKQLASDGYKQIESFEGSKGMFWGMSNIDFKKYMDDLGMAIVSSHCDINKDLEKKANEAAAIGMKY